MILGLSEKLSVAAFYEEGKKGTLKGLRCEAGHVTVPPRGSCRVCHSAGLKIVNLSGNGRIVSFTEVHSKPAGFPIETPYIFALVSLDEGGNLLGVVRANGMKVDQGDTVRVRFVTVSKEKPEPINAEKERPRIFFDRIVT
jgi:uncharacterized OB-fold protein